MQRDESGRFTPEQQRTSTAAASSYGGAESRPWQQQQYGSERISCATRSSAATALGVVAGAGMGAALMFLLDPEQGRRRRERLAAAAAAAAERTSELAHSAWDTTTDAAAGGAAALYAATPSGKEVRRGGRRIWNRTGDAVSSAAESTRDTTGDWLDSAKSYLPSMPHLRRSHRHDEHEVSATTAASGAAGALLLGLGAMWLMDPDRGRARRAWIGQKTNRLLNETSKFMRATGRHMANKSKGYYHESRKAVGSAGQAITDSSIAESIRSSLGKLGLKSSSSVGVECTSGCVTLTGRCVAEDVDVIIATTRGTYGVDNVVNNMEVGTSLESPTSSMPSSI